MVLAGTFMTFLDFFIVNVALPSIQHDLHAGPAAIQLVVAGYGLTFAAGWATCTGGGGCSRSAWPCSPSLRAPLRARPERHVPGHRPGPAMIGGT